MSRRRRGGGGGGGGGGYEGDELVWEDQGITKLFNLWHIVLLKYGAVKYTL